MDGDKRKTNWIYLIGVVLIVFLGVEDILLILQNRKLKSALTPPPLVLVKPGEKVGAFRVQMLDGRFDQLTYVDTVEKYLLFVLSTKCPHCHRTLQQWNEIENNSNNHRCRIIGVSSSDFDQTVKYSDSTNLRFELVTIADTAFYRKYKVYAYPETILIDSKGVVESAWGGELSEKDVGDIEGRIGGGKRF